MAHLSITLFGSFRVELDGEAVTAFKSKKVRGLLAYLAAETQRVHRRDTLAALLWPDWTDKEARNNLRYALSDLRSAIGDRETEPPFLTITRESIQFNTDSDHRIDVGEFTQLLSASGTATLDIGELEKAVNLYQGEFLEGFSISDSTTFQEWLLLMREQLHRQLIDALRKLSASFEEQNEYEQALSYARRQVELEPWQEDGHRQVMRLMAASGQPGAALAQYETCRQLLEADLGTEPSEGTRELYRRIQSGEWGAEDAGAGIIPERPPIPLGECPYRGLAAFREQDADYFFGREGYVEQLLVALRRDPLVAVLVGSSGSGKSSVVYAGLLPHLRADEGWLVADFRPGSSPIRSLAAALIPWLEPELNETDRLVEIRKLGDALEQEEVSLQEVVARTLDKQPETGRMLLFVDQFEELYTLCPDDEVQRILVNQLLSAVEVEKKERADRLVVLLTLRADFMGQVLAYRPFADALQQGTYLLGPMNAEELRAAVEQPAEVQGAVFEDGLVDRILEDVGEEPGKLPLLEFALTLLWEGSDSGKLTHSTYRGIGGVEGALASYADEVYAGLDEDEQQIAQQIFVQLVQPGVSTADTRRVASRTDIGEGNWSLTQYLADKRLVVTGQDVEGRETVEVVHETLIQRWELLAGWIEAARAFRTWQEGLRVAIQLWEQAGQDEGALLRGVPLSQAESWLEEHENELSAVEIDYIQASLALRARRQAERERLRRRITMGLGIGLVLTLILAIFAGLQWRSAQIAQTTAEDERDLTRISLSRLLASQAQLLINDDIDLAHLLSIEAVNIDPSVEARGSLLAALSHNPQLASVLHGHQDEVTSAAFSPDGRRLATGSADGAIVLWEFTGSEGYPILVESAQLPGHNGRIATLSFSPDGSILASGGFDKLIYLWDLTASEPEGLALKEHSGNIWSLAFSPDGRTLVSGGEDGQILLWDTTGDTFPSKKPNFQSLASGDETVASLAFSPDGQTLAAGLGDGSLNLWDFKRLEPIGEQLDGHQRLIRTLAFDPGSHILASGSQDGQIIFWDTRRDSVSFGEPLGPPLKGHDDWITNLAFDPVNDKLISTGKDGRVLIWDLTTFLLTDRPPSSQVLTKLQDPVWSLTYNPDGHWLVTGGEGYRAIVWDLSTVHSLARVLQVEEIEGFERTVRYQPGVSDLVFSQDGRLLATSYEDGVIILWDKASGQPLGNISTKNIPIPGKKPVFQGYNPIYSLAFNPDGRILAAAAGDTHIYLLDSDPNSESFGQALAPPFSGHRKAVNTVAFHPEGKILASGSEDRSIIFWNVAQDSATFGEPLLDVQTDHEFEIMELYYNQTGDNLLSFADSDIIFWDTSTFPPKGDPPIKLSFVERFFEATNRSKTTNSSTSILAWPIDNVIAFLDLEPGSPTFGEMLPESLEGPGGEIEAADISPDDRMLASGDLYDWVQLWDLDNYQRIGPPLVGHINDLTNVRFSPDSLSLVSGDSSGIAILWDLDLESWKREACRRANRNLTQEEWQRYFGEQPYRATCPEIPLEVED